MPRLGVVFKPTQFASTQFAIAHYAGDVTYESLGFLEKNQERLHQDTVDLFASTASTAC